MVGSGMEDICLVLGLEEGLSGIFRYSLSNECVIREIELTSALERVRQVRLEGKMFDMGNYEAFVNCVAGFSK